MGYKLECGADLSNTGGLLDCAPKFGNLAFPILVPKDATIDTEANAKLLTTWTTKFQLASANRWRPLPEVFKYEASKEDDVFVKGDGDQSVFVKDGDRSGMITYMAPSPCMVKALKSLNDTKWDAFLVYRNGYIRGRSTAGVLFQGIPVFIHVSGLKEATNEEPESITVSFNWERSAQVETTQVVIKPTAFNPVTDLEGLKSLTLTESVDGTATGITVTIAKTCDGTAITDLVEADFQLLDGVTPVSLTSVTPDGLGGYAVVFSSVTGVHTFGLKPTTSMTTKGYEGDSAISFTP